MKLSRKFLSDYVDIKDIEFSKLAEDMTNVGNEYDSSTKLIPATNLVIGKVISCADHPDSDHLHVCKVDIGTEVLDIVCGAPNCREGIKVIVAKVGAQLPGGKGLILIFTSRQRNTSLAMILMLSMVKLTPSVPLSGTTFFVCLRGTSSVPSS